MKNPGFFCKQYINTHNNIPKFQPKNLCIKQCDNCINEIIEYHTKKLKK